jgi:hypothetical protein
MWQNDFNYDDFGIDGNPDSIVGLFTCYNDNCDVEDIYICTAVNNKNEE